MAFDTLERVKLSVRVSHNKLDEDIQSDIDSCLADLKVCGIIYAGEEDPLIQNAVKLYCKSLYTDDTAKGAAYMERYNSLKACLQMAEGYGWRDDGGEVFDDG